MDRSQGGAAPKVNTAYAGAYAEKAENAENPEKKENHPPIFLLLSVLSILFIISSGGRLNDSSAATAREGPFALAPTAKAPPRRWAR